MKARLAGLLVLGLLLLGAIRVGAGDDWRHAACDLRMMCGGERRTLTVGYFATLCDLTGPIADWVSANAARGPAFPARRFPDYASMKEALIAGRLQAGFLPVPQAMKLAADGVPVKLVCVAQHGGTDVMVHRDSAARSFSDLRGATLAVPSRLSCQYLLVRRLMEQGGLQDGDLRILEMTSAEMPVALAAGSVDAYCAGNPVAAKSEVEGWGRVLCHADESWPGFIACGLVVRQDLIDGDRDLVQALVNALAASGRWLDAGPAHRADAAQVAGLYYFNQPPALLAFVLRDSPARITYSDLALHPCDLQEIMLQSVRLQLLDRALAFGEYADDSFAPAGEPSECPFDRLPMNPAAVKARCR